MREIVERLAEIVGPDHAMTAPQALEEFAQDGTFVRRAPDLVVRPGSTEEVAAMVAVLSDAGIPMTCRGAGTGLSGGAVAVAGGAVVALDRLTHLEIDPDSLCAVAGAGVVTADLRSAAAEHHLMYPPDPSSLETCTIGGNIATNAGGPACLKYGVTAEYVMGLTVVLAGGRVLRLGGKTRKRSAGYRLAQLFVGSEGTLGIVTEAVLRLLPMPRERVTALAAFSSVEDAARAVASLLQSGHLPSACELIDRSSLDFVADLLPRRFPNDAAAVLLLEQDGSDRSPIAADMKDMLRIAESCGAHAAVTDMEEAGRTDLWAARRAIGARLIERRNFRLPEDIAVPIAAIPEMVRRIHEIGRELGVSIALFGHAGDGNLHPSLVFDDRGPETLRRVGEAAARIFRAALDLGGTVSAEHGLGATKRAFAEEELGADALEIMRGMKQLLDPKGLLNPEKVFPSGPADASFMDSLPGWGAG